MFRVAICGGSGYAGAELLRLLLSHPQAEVTAVTSERSAGKKVADLFPHLHRYSNLLYEHIDKEKLLRKADIFFMALPHGTSQGPTNFFFREGKKVIDLSADYRLRDYPVYEEWYKTPHAFRATLKKAVYGLPEIYRKKIARASLVANPGCYPTGALLGLYPLFKDRSADPSMVVIDSKSGVSGAGRQSAVAYSFCEVNEAFRAYAVKLHRHTPEIEQELSALSGKPVRVDFTPHLIPLDRGILTTIYVKAKKAKDIHALYKAAYAGEPFVRVLDAGGYPNLKNVRGTNLCEIGLALNERTGTAIVITAIDNLVKGAGGQAIQNMNIMLGLDESSGLEQAALFP